MGYTGESLGLGFCVWCSMIALGFILFYFLRHDINSPAEHFSAQDILDRRYSNGEIDRETYEEKSNALKRIA